MTLYALVRADGSIAAQVDTRPGLTPTQDGSNPDGLKEVAVARRGNLALEQLSGSSWAEVPALVETMLIGLVKTRAEELKMLDATVGGYKKAEYAAKRNEVIAWDELGSTLAAILTAFNAMLPLRRAITFEYAIADAAAFGDAPADAIARFRKGITAASDTSRLSGIEARSCAAIRAAPTAAAKRAVFTSINWS